ncbi:MAG: collagen-binding protein [Propionibacteriaceae bacterium]|nr:collagen-binding protein [Propionibacteriaceae bacterium]
MLRTLLRSAAALAGLITWVTVVALPVPADAETTDGTLTVIVNRDFDANGIYDGTIDRPQPGIEIAVTDASGAHVAGVTDREGTFVLDATSKLKGGRYFVVAEIPAALSDLAPVSESSSFQPLSTAVDVTSEDQTVRMGVAAGRTSSEAPRSDEAGSRSVTWSGATTTAQASRTQGSRPRAGSASSCSTSRARSSPRR